jgi:hypothetical protein
MMVLESTAIIILWVAGTIILFLAVAYLIRNVTSTTEEVVCRNSVILRSKATLTIPIAGMDIAKIEKFTPLACTPQNIGMLKGSREEIKHQIAELSARCWWMYLEGSVPNLFDSKEKNESSCGICYYFQIPANMDAGSVSTEYVYFQELTKKNLTILKEREPDLQGLEFNYETINYDNTEIIRPKNLISQQEFYNFLLAEQYNPKVIYGGGTQNYIGDVHEFTSLINTRNEEIRLRDIKEFPPTHLLDNAFLITQETQEKIMEFGAKLYRQENSILLVVVAEKINRNDRQDARRLIEQLNLNSMNGIYDAVLITIDVSKGEIRIHAGNYLERRVKEYELSMMLQNSFSSTITSQKDLNTALTRLINSLEQKILVPRQHSDLRLPEGTYYEYLSNEQTTAPIIENLMADRTYAITYASISDYQSRFDSLKQSPDMLYVGALAVGGVLLSLTGKGAFIGLPLIKTAFGLVTTTTAIAGLMTISYFTYSDNSFPDAFSALFGRLGSGIGDNSIFIVPASAVSTICDEV